MARFQPPNYVSEAADRYIGCGTRHAHATIALSLAAGEWCQEIQSGVYGVVPKDTTAQRIVREFLLRRVRDKGLASRYLAIARLAGMAEAQHLKLDGIRSQGTLFAALPIIRRAELDGTPLDLRALLDDASTMTIGDFRAKWNPSSRRRKLSLHVIEAWIAATDKYDLLQQAQRLIDLRIQELQVVSSQPMTF